MLHKHTWKRDPTRKHGDHKRGRFFVICTDPQCGATSQAVIQYGYLHTFQTNHYRGGSNVISLRVTDQEYKNYQADKEGFKRQARQLLK
jgi:hypothetical protein